MDDRSLKKSNFNEKVGVVIKKKPFSMKKQSVFLKGRRDAGGFLL